MEETGGARTGGDQFAGFGAFVEGGVVRDDDMLGGERGSELPGQRC